MDELGNEVFISVQGKDTMVLVIGGGTSAYIKVKTFLKRGFTVHVIAKEFSLEVENLNDTEKGLTLLKKEFQKELLDNYHLIVLCTNDKIFNEEIRNLCKVKRKMFIDTATPEESQATLCATRESKNVALGIKIRGKNPKASVYLCNKGIKYFEELDNFVEYITNIRNNIEDSKFKKEVVTFLCSDDFLFFYKCGKGKEILNMFYPDLILG